MDHCLELGVCEHAHLRFVEAGDLVGLLDRMPPLPIALETLSSTLKNVYTIPNMTVQITSAPTAFTFAFLI